MRPIINIIVLLFLSNTLVAQSYKDDISVVQFSAPFTKASEISKKIETLRPYFVGRWEKEV